MSDMLQTSSWPHPNEWKPSNLLEAIGLEYIHKPFGHDDTILRSINKNPNSQCLIKNLIKGLELQGDNWSAGVAKTEQLLGGQGNPCQHALEELVGSGYMREAEGHVYMTDALKAALVNTAHERFTTDTDLIKAVRAVAQPTVADAAAKTGRAWYKFATHTLENGKAVFSAPRTAVSGAILLGAGLVANHYLKASNDDSWQQRTEAKAAEAASRQR